jgi:hypothetical protein
MAHSDKPDLVEDLMRRLGDASRPPRHLFGLVRFFVEQRARIAASYKYVGHSPERVSAVLYGAATESGRIAEAEGRTGLLRELTAAFLDASERQKREDAWGDLYAADAADGDDSFAEASALEAGSRWRSAT